LTAARRFAAKKVVSDHYQIVVLGELDEPGVAHAMKQLHQFLRDHRYAGSALEPEPHAEERLRPWLVAAGLDEETVQEQLAKAHRRLARRLAFISGENAADVVGGPPVPARIPDPAFGIEFVMGWEVHGDANAEYSGVCPGCGATVRGLHPSKDRLAAATCKIEDDPIAELACDACNKGWPLRSWTFEPPLFVSNLALRFGNWGPLRPRFIADLERVTGSRARVTSEIV
jgi:hypothetical protein